MQDLEVEITTSEAEELRQHYSKKALRLRRAIIAGSIALHLLGALLTLALGKAFPGSTDHAFWLSFIVSGGFFIRLRSSVEKAAPIAVALAAGGMVSTVTGAALAANSSFETLKALNLSPALVFGASSATLILFYHKVACLVLVKLVRAQNQVMKIDLFRAKQENKALRKEVQELRKEERELRERMDHGKG